MQSKPQTAKKDFHQEEVDPHEFFTDTTLMLIETFLYTNIIYRNLYENL